MNAILYLFAVCALCVPAYLLHGWATAILWGWFVAPVFQVREISTAEALGLCLVLALARLRRNPSSEGKTNEEKLWDVAAVFLAPLLLLAVGWIVKQWT